MSGVTFNLMDRPWIPVTMLSDGTHRELSLRDALLEAHQIRAIDGDIPVQRFTLSRLLIAVLYGVFASDVSMSGDLWKEILQAGPENLDIKKLILEYCDRYSDRFDLFDAKQPFYQVADLHTSKDDVSGLERLALDVPSGDPFFTIRAGEGLAFMNAAQAARWLVVLQAFDSSGIKSGAVGDPRVKNSKGYPIGTAWCGGIGGLMIEGKDLWKTLVLNLVSEDVFEAGESEISWNDDKPIWERPQLTEKPAEGFNQEQENVGNTAFFHGPATLLTWQSRRVRLFHDGETVTGILVCNGDRLKPQNAYGYEMMTAWRRSAPQEKALKRQGVYMPRKHVPARALWRGLALFTAASESTTGDGLPASRRPYSMNWLTKMRRDDDADGFLANMPIRLHAFGIEYGNQEAVVDSAIDDVLDLNLALITSTDPELHELLEWAVAVTDQGVMALRNLASNVARAAGLPDEAPRDGIAETAYSAFDLRFRQWVRTIRSPFDYEQLESAWQDIARRLLWSIAGQYLSSAPTKAIVGRNIPDEADPNGFKHFDTALASRRFGAALNKIFPIEKTGDHDETK